MRVRVSLSALLALIVWIPPAGLAGEGQSACVAQAGGEAAATARALRVTGNRLFVRVSINGTCVEALLDSGAEMTLVDSAFAERLGLALFGQERVKGTGGEQAARFARDIEIHTTGTHLENRTAVVLDLGGISRRLVGEPVHVVVGRELFDAGRFYLDIENRAFHRVAPDGGAPGVRLPLTDHRGIKQFPLTVDGVTTRADFDLGNGSEMLIGEAFAEAQGWLAPGRRAGTRAGGGVGGELLRDLIVLETVEIAGVAHHGVLAAVDATPNASAANVGVSLLRNFALTIDFPSNTLWLAPVERGRAP